MRGPLSRARILPGVAADGRVTFPVEIVLDGAAITYWLWPGAAGVPPRASSAGSTNVSGLAVAYPVPRRIDEAGSEVLGYARSVTFPVTATAWAPGLPGVLRLSLDYATCDRVCVPAHADLVAPFPASAREADAGRPVEAASKLPLALASAAVPVPDPGPFPGTVTAAAAPTWRVTLPAGAAFEDLLAGSDAADASTVRTGPSSWDLRVEPARPGAVVTLVGTGPHPRSWSVALPPR